MAVSSSITFLTACRLRPQHELRAINIMMLSSIAMAIQPLHAGGYRLIRSLGDCRWHRQGVGVPLTLPTVLLPSFSLRPRALQTPHPLIPKRYLVHIIPGKCLLQINAMGQSYLHPNERLSISCSGAEGRRHRLLSASWKACFKTYPI